MLDNKGLIRVCKMLVFSHTFSHLLGRFVIKILILMIGNPLGVVMNLNYKFYSGDVDTCREEGLYR